MKKSLNRDFFWNSLGVFCQNLISPLLLVIISHFNSPEDLGMFSVLFSFSVTLYLFNLWGGRTYQISDIKKKHGTEEFIFSRIILSVLVLIFATLFSIFNGYDTIKTTLFLILVIFKSIEALSDVLYGVMQINKQLYKSGISLFVKFILGFISFLVVNILTKNLILASLAITVSNILVMIFYDVPTVLKLENLSFISTKYRKKSLSLLKKTWIICVISVASSLLLNIPRYFVDNYHQAESGFFGVVAMPITLVALVLSFIIQPQLVEISELFAKKSWQKAKKIIRKIVLASLIIGIIILIGAIFAGLPVLKIIFNLQTDKYSQMSLVLLLLGGIFSAISAIYINILTILRKMNSALVVLIGCVIFAVISSILFIPNAASGTLFAAQIFVLTNLVQMISLYIIFRKYTKD